METQAEVRELPPELARISQGRDFIRTEEFARTLGRAPATIRKNVCLGGHCFGVKPQRVAGRLLWSVSDTARLLDAQPPHAMSGDCGLEGTAP